METLMREIQKIQPHITPEQLKQFFIIKHCVIDNPYIPHMPTDKQLRFLKLLDEEEALYGGSAGGGKSESLLMAALMFVDVPGYNALILRQTYKDLALPGAIMDRSKEWLGKHTELHWDEKEKKWTFPSGATLSFGYLFGPNDKYNYQSANFHFIGFDELTQFREADYLYLFSRLRKGSDDQLPLRLRSASNPGGKGHEWVKERFIDGNIPFIPARLSDNPYLNIDEYMNALSKLDPVTREQLLNGDWDVVVTGNMFKPQWFDIIEEAPRNGQDVRFWDLAATADTGQNDPDYCSGLLLSRISANRYVVKDLVRFRADPGETQDIIVATAKRDGFQVSIVIEQEGGAAAKLYIETLRKQILQGKYHVVESKPDKSKIVRAQAVSAAASRKEISLVRAEWNKAFLSELSRFPEVEHDDQTDSFSGSYNWLNQKSNVTRERIPIRKPLKPGSGLSS